MKYLILTLFTFCFSFQLLAYDLSVMTWNTFLLPPPLNLTKQSERVKLMSQKLKNNDHDIIFFQEAWVKRYQEAIINELKSEYPYVAFTKPGEGLLQILGSGLFILSKYPINILDQVVFNDCSGADCFASKSAIMIELTLPYNKTIQMITTHLQGWSGEEMIKIRNNQLLEIKNMTKRHLKKGVAQVLVGDLNIDGNNKLEYDNALTLMEMTSTSLVGKLGWSNGFRTTDCFDTPGGENPGEWLDHFWLNANGTDTLIHFKKVIPIIGILGNKECPLSDHYAVEALVEVNDQRELKLAKNIHSNISRRF
jgi:endonuclease/exonuclease/phosphatase family metal-dependent hydrolase